MHEKRTNIAHLLNQYRSSHQIPGLAVSIIDNGEVVYSQGFGTYDADTPYNLVTEDTLFSIQGITESFTASALVHLEEHSTFQLDTPVVEYLPYFQTKRGDYEKVTTAHLLSHTAGFRENNSVVSLLDENMYNFVKNMPEYKKMIESISDVDRLRENLTSREKVTRYFSNLNLKTDPGEQFQYCSDAYMIAADVLEKVSGMTWEEYVTSHIFKPLSLTNTTINLPANLDGKTAAKYYMKGIGTPIQTPTPYNEVGTPVSSIFSTASDLSRYLIAQMTPGELLSAESLEKMQSAQVNIGEKSGYGYGWQVSEHHGLKAMEQSGSCPGISSALAFIPEKQFGIVFLCNTDMIQLEKLGRRIIRRWFS